MNIIQKKVTIIGPIAYTGGRAVEAREIFEALCQYYRVSILSTESYNSVITPNSPLIGTDYQFLDKIILDSNNNIKFLSYLSWIKNFFKGRPEQYLNSKVNKKLAGLINKRKSVISQTVENADMIFLLMQINSEYLKEIINYSKANNTPIIFRPTGKIAVIPEKIKSSLPHINKFICHSPKNTIQLKPFKKNFSIIDQNAFQEDKLVHLPITINKPLTFGFLGRFSSEKGGIELADFFSSRTEKFIMAGDGPDKEKILKTIESSNSCEYYGAILVDQIDEFMERIDILVIPSNDRETGPYTGIEAMAAGKIIFSTKVGAMEDRLKDTANDFWFDVNNLNSLSKLIERVNQFSNEELLNISRINRDKYSKNYRRAIISNSYLEECKKLLK
ncbi:glycosyltransferase [Salegentibacter sp. BDJ18]|uniref:glycosyltransferase n=1 Tax=Salegentibacter sp. BDJ18 TaxID=2816376 RepID=UPI001AAEFBEF|nr:glycosyltransferase [Salegentibacter sp. BDJ18]MBO2544277.1 glycosyltransferase [Salegentibacter sp. BDJ18]